MVEEEADGKGEIRSNRFPEQLQITDKLTFGKLNDFFFFFINGRKCHLFDYGL